VLSTPSVEAFVSSWLERGETEIARRVDLELPVYAVLR